MLNAVRVLPEAAMGPEVGSSARKAPSFIDTVSLIFPYMDASRSASVLTIVLAERGGCGLISGLQCKAVSPAALMVSVIDASSP